MHFVLRFALQHCGTSAKLLKRKCSGPCALAKFRFAALPSKAQYSQARHKRDLDCARAPRAAPTAFCRSLSAALCAAGAAPPLVHPGPAALGAQLQRFDCGQQPRQPSAAAGASGAAALAGCASFRPRGCAGLGTPAPHALRGAACCGLLSDSGRARVPMPAVAHMCRMGG
jgi:hypothetical protein